MVCIIHAFPGESTGFGWVTDFPPQVSISNGAVVIWLRHWIRWSWACNSELILALPRVSGCTGLCWYPQHPLSTGLVLPGLSLWWRKHGLGSNLLMVLTLIKRTKEQLVGPCPTLQIIAGNSPLSHSGRCGGVFFGLGLLVFFQMSCQLVIFPSWCKLFSKVCTHLAFGQWEHMSLH